MSLPNQPHCLPLDENLWDEKTPPTTSTKQRLDMSLNQPARIENLHEEGNPPPKESSTGLPEVLSILPADSETTAVVDILEENKGEHCCV